MNTFWAEFMVDCFKCSIYTSKYISMFIHHIECTTLRELPIFPRSYVSCNYHIMNVRNVICIYVTIVQYPVHQDELFHYTWVQIPMSIEFNWLSFVHIGEWWDFYPGNIREAWSEEYRVITLCDKWCFGYHISKLPCCVYRKNWNVC